MIQFIKSTPSWLFHFLGVYISETVHSSRRGSLAAFQSLFLSIGMMIILGIGYCLKDWRTLAWICVIPGLINIVMMIFLHETPSWLLDHDKPEEARYYPTRLKGLYGIM